MYHAAKRGLAVYDGRPWVSEWPAFSDVMFPARCVGQYCRMPLLSALTCVDIERHAGYDMD